MTIVRLIAFVSVLGRAFSIFGCELTFECVNCQLHPIGDSHFSENASQLVLDCLLAEADAFIQALTQMPISRTLRGFLPFPLRQISCHARHMSADQVTSSKTHMPPRETCG
jgi:hypothetical protein